MTTYFLPDVRRHQTAKFYKNKYIKKKIYIYIHRSKYQHIIFICRKCKRKKKYLTDQHDFEPGNLQQKNWKIIHLQPRSGLNVEINVLCFSQGLMWREVCSWGSCVERGDVSPGGADILRCISISGCLLLPQRLSLTGVLSHRSHVMETLASLLYI